MSDSTNEGLQFMDELQRVMSYVRLCNGKAGRDKINAPYNYREILRAISANPLVTDGVMDVVAVKAAYLKAFTGIDLQPESAHVDEHLGEGVAAIWSAIPQAHIRDDLGEFVFKLSSLDRRTFWATACCSLATLKLIRQEMEEQGALAALAMFEIEYGTLRNFLVAYLHLLRSHLQDNTICRATDEVCQQIRALVLQ
ncbi:MAG: hypothetical protein ABIH67_03875 [Candidatus Uhrbacteria bacterium]